MFPYFSPCFPVTGSTQVFVEKSGMTTSCSYLVPPRWRHCCGSRCSAASLCSWAVLNLAWNPPIGGWMSPRCRRCRSRLRKDRFDELNVHCLGFTIHSWVYVYRKRASFWFEIDIIDGVFIDLIYLRMWERQTVKQLMCWRENLEDRADLYLGSKPVVSSQASLKLTQWVKPELQEIIHELDLWTESSWHMD